MKSTENVLNFIGVLAEVRDMFLVAHVDAEKNPALHHISTAVIPFKGEPSAYARDGVTVSIALNAELRRPVEAEKKALGMSMLLRHTGEHWLVECEVGWSGENIGWDQFDSKELQVSSIEAVSEEIAPIVDWLRTRFLEEAARLIP